MKIIDLAIALIELATAVITRWPDDQDRESQEPLPDSDKES